MVPVKRSWLALAGVVALILAGVAYRIGESAGAESVCQQFVSVYKQQQKDYPGSAFAQAQFDVLTSQSDPCQKVDPFTTNDIPLPVPS